METTSLKLSDSFEVGADAARVWSLLSNPQAVVGCMPGAAITGAADDGALLGAIVAVLGPTRVTFQGTVVPEFDAANGSGRLRARGQDARGRTKAVATASFQLTTAGECQTRVDFESNIDMSGGLAPFMRTGGQQMLRRMLQDFAANFATFAAADDSAAAEQGAESGPEGAGTVQQVKPVQALQLAVRALLDAGRSVARRLRGRTRHQRLRAGKGEQQ